MSGWLILLAWLIVQRLGELAWSARNTRRLLAAGAEEVGAAHYPLFFVLHGGWILSLLFFVPTDPPLDVRFLAAFITLQAMRFWIIADLGPYWTTRILTTRNAPLVQRGLYRLMRHPNYAVVAFEIPIVPLIAGAWQIALVFGTLNIVLLWWRIRIEDVALVGRRERSS
jgi:methyltransferase